MSTRSSSSCSGRYTEESFSSNPSTPGSLAVVGSPGRSKINRESFEKTLTTFPSFVSTTSSFDVVQSQFQDLMNLKNVLINKASQQLNTKNYIVDQQQKGRLNTTSDDRSSPREDGDDDSELCSPREKAEEEKTSMITVPCEQYESLIRQLEVERIEHAKTKTKCEELADHQDFARGQIEILQKQLQREKDNFRQVLGSVQESTKVGDERKDRLETRVKELHEDNQQLARRLRTKDSEIEKLQEALAKEKSSQDKRIIDMEVRKCQDDYISSFLSKTGSGRPQYAKKGYPSVKDDHRKTKLSS